MKAVVLLCLLHAALIQAQFNWPEPEETGIVHVDVKKGCESNREVCGCCLMQRQIQRFREFFDYMVEEMRMELSFSQMTLKNHTKARSSIFSVGLSNTDTLYCFGPFGTQMTIPFDHVLVNMGNIYSMDTHTFTVPFSGVYSLSVTLYGHHSSENSWPTCAQLKVNDQMMASLPATNGHYDGDDSTTEVIAIKLTTGDQVSVVMPAGCAVCDDVRHMTVFTGFFLFTTD